MGIFKPGNKAYAIFNFKCPRCMEGNQYPTFSFPTAFKMEDKCSHCEQTYLPEPGFYYGAMFISYILSGFYSLGFVAVCIFGFGLSANQSFLILLFTLIVMFIYIFRISRSIWLCLMVKYDKKYVQPKK